MSNDNDPGLFDLLHDIERMRHKVAEGGPVSKWLAAIKMKVETDAETYATRQIERKSENYVRQRSAMVKAVQAEDGLHAELYRAKQAKNARALQGGTPPALPPAQQQAISAPAQRALPAAGPSQSAHPADPQQEDHLALSLVLQAIDDGWVYDDRKWRAAMDGATPESLPPGVSLQRVRALADRHRQDFLKD